MKEKLAELLATAIKQAYNFELSCDNNIEPSKQAANGDYASNIAMVLAKQLKQKPIAIAENILAEISKVKNPLISQIEVKAPGFINFFLNSDALLSTVKEVLTKGPKFGSNNLGEGKTVLIEFVSSNPTGPLHVGHGRGAAYGATLANLLTTCGYKVSKEYYVNDAGRQMHILALSLFLRYLEQAKIKLAFPKNGYQGDYLIAIAKKVHDKFQDKYVIDVDNLYANLPLDEQADGSGDKEAYVDKLIDNLQKILPEDTYNFFFQTALDEILLSIKQDLLDFGVEFDAWFHESALVAQKAVDKALAKLDAKGYIYEQDGAKWFRATEFGDDKDRVLIRENGQATYFCNDIAYHVDKFERGYDSIIDILGSDHHGYVPRVAASLQAIYGNTDKFSAQFVQFAILYRGGEKVQMSTRSGSFVTLKDLTQEVGKDAARIFYVMRKPEQHLDFDLELAKAKNNENPVYYIGYAHARVSSALNQLKEKGYNYNQSIGIANLSLLNLSLERELMLQLSGYPEMLEHAAKLHEPHALIHFLRNLAGKFHSYYNSSQFIVEDDNLRNARFALILAVKQIIANGLTILGASAPDKM